jgi:hypothetical protein
MITFNITCKRADNGSSFSIARAEIHEVASFTTMHTSDVVDLVSASMTYGDGTVVTVTRNPVSTETNNQEGED